MYVRDDEHSPSRLLQGENLTDLAAQLLKSGNRNAEKAPVFRLGEELTLRGEAYTVEAFDAQGMLLEPKKAGKTANLAMRDFVKLKGFWCRVYQLRAAGGVRVEPWGWPGKDGKPPAKGWNRPAEEQPGGDELEALRRERAAFQKAMDERAKGEG